MKYGRLQHFPDSILTLTGSIMVIVSSSEQIESSCLITDCSMYTCEGHIKLTPPWRLCLVSTLQGSFGHNRGLVPTETEE